MIYRLKRAKDEYRPSLDHPWNRTTTRFLRDLRMLGADNDAIAVLLNDLLEIVDPRNKWGEGLRGRKQA